MVRQSPRRRSTQTGAGGEVNQRAQIFAWLDRARTNRDTGLEVLLISSFLLRYRDDPRFAASGGKSDCLRPSPPRRCREPAAITDKSTFLAERKRRNAIHMAGLYLIGAWLIVQVSSTMLPTFDMPSWELRGLTITLDLRPVQASLAYSNGSFFSIELSTANSRNWPVSDQRRRLEAGMRAARCNRRAMLNVLISIAWAVQARPHGRGKRQIRLRVQSQANQARNRGSYAIANWCRAHRLQSNTLH